MKKAAIALVLTVVAFAATSTLAQANFTLHADVPFNFAIDGRQYAAGPYELQTINSNAMRLHNTKTGASGLVMLTTRQNPKVGVSSATPQLRFVLNGDRGYLLSLTDQEGNTFRVPVARRDLEASRKPESKNAVVALR